MKRIATAAVMAAVAALSAVGCAATKKVIAVEDGGGDESGDGGLTAPSFTPPPTDSGADDAQVSAVRAMCIATDCPAPYATCPPEYGEYFKCETNLDNDNNNCGVCGAKCPTFGPLNAASRCANGACVLNCAMDYADCNGIIDDGCEVYLEEDSANCGACGKKCAPGVRCQDGKCGCPLGYVDCNGSCVDLDTNGNNCGACGNVCRNPEDAGPAPPNAQYVCAGGECGKLACHFFYADCNHDLGSATGDGCEIRTSNDPKNCGKCGIVCAPGEICSFVVGQAPVAICHPPNTAELCRGEPVDFTSDLLNCGACDLRCETTFPQMVPTCRKGLCEYSCKDGWADCDGNLENGCEVNLLVNGANCGACGHACETGAGQPCILGKCLTQECDAGGGVQ